MRRVRIYRFLRCRPVTYALTVLAVGGWSGLLMAANGIPAERLGMYAEWTLFTAVAAGIARLIVKPAAKAEIATALKEHEKDSHAKLGDRLQRVEERVNAIHVNTVLIARELKITPEDE